VVRALGFRFDRLGLSGRLCGGFYRADRVSLLRVGLGEPSDDLMQPLSFVLTALQLTLQGSHPVEDLRDKFGLVVAWYAGIGRLVRLRRTID
jgi:hypothetical protein